VTDGPFRGATRDPIALLEQLLGHVAGVKQDIAGLRQDLDQFKQEVRQGLSEVRRELSELGQRVDRLEHRADHVLAELDALRGEVRTEMAAVRSDLGLLRGDVARFITGADRHEAAVKVIMEEAIERRTWLMAERVRTELQDRYDNLERRLTQLEDAERRRREGIGV